MPKIKLAVPNKGRMQQSILELLGDAGLSMRGGQHERALVAQLGEDFEAMFVRAADIPELIADGVVDAGITGWDLVCEADRGLELLLDLELGQCTLILAAPIGSEFTTPEDIPDGARIATSFPSLTARFFADRNKSIVVVPVSGAAEVAPQLGIADAIVDLTSTGSTLRVNGLHQVDVVLESSARLVTRTDTEHARELDELSVALQSVLQAKGKRYLMANIPRANVEKINKILPGINGPTIIDIFGSTDEVAIHAVVDASAIYRTIADLKILGAEGILVTRIERLMA